MNKKRLIITSTISVILVTIMLIGSTYSIFTTSEIDENSNVYKTGVLDITYTLTDNNISLTSNVPTSNDNSCQIVPLRMTITNNGTVAYKFNIILNDTTANNAIDHQYISTQVGKYEPKALSECTDNIIKENIVIPANSSMDIDIRVFVSDTVPNSEINNAFYAKIAIDGLAINNDNLEIDTDSLIADACYNIFTETILKPNAQSDESLDFSQTSEESNTNGIYLRSGTESRSNPIYYYRGNVNNNLVFADTCWKIVRTTETGGLKLIYNGVPSNNTCNNTSTSSQIGTKVFNSSYTSPAYLGYMYSSPYTYSSKTMSSVTDTYYYGKSVTYSGGTYTLVNTISSSSWSSIYNGGLNNNHYSCLSTGTTCSSVYYIYYTTSSKAYYITLTNGKTVEDALVDMLGADDENTANYNTTSSTIKGNSTTEGTLDYWYYTNIDQKGYGDYIEDTVWCNDRSIYQLNGWDPNGGSTTSYLYFGSYGRAYSTYTPSLTCNRDIDKFTVSTDTGNGTLDYPVGLLTSDEVMLAGGANSSNSTYYLYTGENYWLGTPYGFRHSAHEFYVSSSGYLASSLVDATNGVRPSISLKPGFSLTGSGDGTVNNPYIVE